MYNFQIDMTALQHRIQHFYLLTARYHTCDIVVNYQSNLRTPSHFIQNCPQYDAVWGQKDEKFPSTTMILKGLFPFLCVLKDLIYKSMHITENHVLWQVSLLGLLLFEQRVPSEATGISFSAFCVQ